MRPISLRARVLLKVCCLVTLLLSAQHAALTHALWHAWQKVPAQHDQVVAGALQAPAGPEASALCVFDAAFGEVLGAAPAADYRHDAPTSADETPAHAGRLFVVQQSLAPRSRGPPALL